jgi:hypothetical protein
MKQAVWIFLGWFALINIAQAKEVCLRYEPNNVTLSGKLVRLTFPGRPNFDSIENGDEPETGFYLELSHTICTEAAINSDDPSLRGIKLVQLVLNKNGYSTLKPSIGNNVTLNGSLFAAMTGHHHAPVLLQNVKKQ